MCRCWGWKFTHILRIMVSHFTRPKTLWWRRWVSWIGSLWYTKRISSRGEKTYWTWWGAIHFKILFKRPPLHHPWTSCCNASRQSISRRTRWRGGGYGGWRQSGRWHKGWRRGEAGVIGFTQQLEVRHWKKAMWAATPHIKLVLELTMDDTRDMFSKGATTTFR